VINIKKVKRDECTQSIFETGYVSHLARVHLQRSTRANMTPLFDDVTWRTGTRDVKQSWHSWFSDELQIPADLLTWRNMNESCLARLPKCTLRKPTLRRSVEGETRWEFWSPPSGKSWEFHIEEACRREFLPILKLAISVKSSKRNLKIYLIFLDQEVGKMYDIYYIILILLYIYLIILYNFIYLFNY